MYFDTYFIKYLLFFWNLASYIRVILREQQYQFHFVLMLMWSCTKPYSTRFIIRKYFCRERIYNSPLFNKRSCKFAEGTRKSRGYSYPNPVRLSQTWRNKLKTQPTGEWWTTIINLILKKKKKILNCSWKKKKFIFVD